MDETTYKTDCCALADSLDDTQLQTLERMLGFLLHLANTQPREASQAAIAYANGACVFAERKKS